MSPSARDLWLGRLTGSATLVASGILVLIVIYVLKEAWPALERIGPLRFLGDESWHPTENRFGMMPMLTASFVVSAGSLALAAPLGIASALFCRFYAPQWLSILYYWGVVLLAGIPSVVLGLLGLTVVVPLIAWFQPPGASLLAGILILTVMIVPTVALTAEAALAAVPQSYLKGATALGLSREGAILGVLLPVARDSIAAGLLLAAARALGETMVVLMVAGNVVQMPDSLFAPVRTLTANIALEMAYAMEDHRSALFVSGLVLTLLVLVLSIGGARLGQERGRD